MKKVWTALFLAIAVIVLSFTAVLAETPSPWAESEVEAAVNAGFVPETLQGAYTDNITRQEFAALAVRFMAAELGYTREELTAQICEKEAPVHFTDCLDEAVLLAARLGVVNGFGDGAFQPDTEITRAQAAVMLYRLYDCYSISKDLGYFIAFEDKPLIPGWAFTEIQFCLAGGVMEGVSETHFEPQGTYTREQAIVTFKRLGDITDWEKDTLDARYSRKLTREEAVSLYMDEDWKSLDSRFDTPYGTVLYWHTSGIPHSPSFSLVLITEDGKSYGLCKDVPPANGWYSGPPLENLTLSEDQSKMTYEVSFGSRAAIQMDGEKVLHEAGTYYFEADLAKKENWLVEFVPLPEAPAAPEPEEPYSPPDPAVREAAALAYLERDYVKELLKRIDTKGFGTLLYVRTNTSGEPENPLWDRYLLVLIDNDGADHILGNGDEPVLNRYGKNAEITEISLSSGDSLVYFERIYRREDYAAGMEVSKPGRYYSFVQLITLEATSQFIPDEA